MAGLLALRDKFDLAFANDPDYDRHGIVTPKGLMNPNHYLAVAINYLFQHRPQWGADVAVGKTLVSSAMIDRVVADPGRKLVEVPVGFKWFVDGLFDGSLGFGGEESAGASFLRFNGKPWSTDKDGIIMCLLAAEITAVTGENPQHHYDDLAKRFGAPSYNRIQAPATAAQKRRCPSCRRRWSRPIPGGRPDHRPSDCGTGQRRVDWRPESDDRQRLVRGPSFRYRRRIQDLLRELPRGGTPREDRARSGRDRQRSVGFRQVIAFLD